MLLPLLACISALAPAQEPMQQPGSFVPS
jgi:hypothetical protein